MKFSYAYMAIFMCALMVQAGCSTQSHSVAQDYSFDAHPDEGLIAFSTRYDLHCEAPPIGSHAYITYQQGTDHQNVILHNPFVSHDLDNPPGYIYLKALKAGDYNFTWVDVNLGNRQYSLKLVKPVPFRVEQGKIKYLGELTAKISSCRTEVVGEIPLNVATIVLSTENQWSRDNKVLKQRYQTLFSNKVAVDLLKP